MAGSTDRHRLSYSAEGVEIALFKGAEVTDCYRWLWFVVLVLYLLPLPLPAPLHTIQCDICFLLSLDQSNIALPFRRSPNQSHNHIVTIPPITDRSLPLLCLFNPSHSTNRCTPIGSQTPRDFPPPTISHCKLSVAVGCRSEPRTVADRTPF